MKQAVDSHQTWSAAATELTASSLGELLAGTIPAIHVATFATADECRRLCGALHQSKVKGREATTSPMRIVGSNFSNFRGSTKANYFATVDPAYRELKRLFEVSFDPVERMLRQLRAVWPAEVDIASEPEHGRYFAGNIKSRSAGSALHFDYVPRLAPTYQIGRIEDQLSWNLYLDMPWTTGETTLYNAPIPTGPTTTVTTTADSGWSNKVDPESVAHSERYTFQPRVGETVLFNTRCPHTVTVSGIGDHESRVQIGSFIGRFADDSLALWS